MTFKEFRESILLFRPKTSLNSLPGRCTHFLRLLLLCAAVAVPAALAEGTDVGVVLNQSVSQEHLTLLTLRSIFSQRKRSWEDGTPITVVVLPDDHPLHRLFCRTKLKIYPYVLRDHWDRLMFSGTGTAPRLAKSEAELIEIVRITPGAIGYQSIATDTEDNEGILVTKLPLQRQPGQTGAQQ